MHLEVTCISGNLFVARADPATRRVGQKRETTHLTFAMPQIRSQSRRITNLGPILIGNPSITPRIGEPNPLSAWPVIQTRTDQFIKSARRFPLSTRYSCEA